ncbi:rhamnulokinase [Christensenella intestinihominis]|uniref:rhamnulokinase n=1 Tax=Christensenella intestinihominis TaxID=1851429 RepID=UPI0008329699|nr:rhamnulokinase family protein [Christensenella intestinihominis]
MSRILAFDFGASSGRAMIAQYADGKITMEELHRFTNDPVSINGTLFWDALRLFYNIKQGITKAVNAGGFDMIGIDTWGVDFGLIGEDGQLIQNPVHYRDGRSEKPFEEFFRRVDPAELYSKVGLQHMAINTLYQLIYLKENKPELFAATKKILFTPDLYSYFLTGEMKSEYTIASTSEMLDAKKRDWSEEVLELAGIPREKLCDITPPGSQYGLLRDDICEELGAPRAKVMCTASHDTASAVAAVPTQEEDFIFISCGTWSLLGTELHEPCLNDKAAEYNFANEGGVAGTYRFLKNIMGTWPIQESRRQWIREGKEFGFGELEQMAKECKPFRSLIDVDSPEFGKPGNIPRRIRAYCEKTGQPVPQTEGEVIRCIDESLAMKFRYSIERLAECTGRKYNTVHILGGGTKSALLCQMTADATGMNVVAGPDEATGFGNIAVQLIAAGEIKDIKEARRVVAASCAPKTYAPQNTAEWDTQYQAFVKIIEG